MRRPGACRHARPAAGPRQVVASCFSTVLRSPAPARLSAGPPDGPAAGGGRAVHHPARVRPSGAARLLQHRRLRCAAAASKSAGGCCLQATARGCAHCGCSRARASSAVLPLPQQPDPPTSAWLPLLCFALACCRPQWPPATCLSSWRCPPPPLCWRCSTARQLPSWTARCCRRVHALRGRSWAGLDRAWRGRLAAARTPRRAEPLVPCKPPGCHSFTHAHTASPSGVPPRLQLDPGRHARRPGAPQPPAGGERGGHAARRAGAAASPSRGGQGGPLGPGKAAQGRAGGGAAEQRACPSSCPHSLAAGPGRACATSPASNPTAPPCPALPPPAAPPPGQPRGAVRSVPAAPPAGAGGARAGRGGG